MHKDMKIYCRALQLNSSARTIVSYDYDCQFETKLITIDPINTHYAT